MKDKDHKMLEEAWKQVYVEEPNMSPEEAHEAHGRGETLMVTTADGVEFIVDPANDDTVEADPQNGLVFMGSDPDGGEVEVRADDISMIKSLSDKESIRGFDPNKSHEAQFTGNPELAQQGKPVSWESTDHEKEEEEDDKKKKNSHEWDARGKKYFKPKKLAQESTSRDELEANVEDAIRRHKPGAASLDDLKDKVFMDLYIDDDAHDRALDEIINHMLGEANVKEGLLDPGGMRSKAVKKLSKPGEIASKITGIPNVKPPCIGCDDEEVEEEEKSLEEIAEDHWSQMPAAKTLHNFKKAISDLEPAGDVREWYVDAADAGVDTRVLDKILIVAVKTGDLHRAEAHFIKTGSQDHPDQDPSDTGERLGTADEGCGGPAVVAHDHEDEEDKVKAIIIKRIKGIRPESTNVNEKQSCPPGYYWCTKSNKCKKKDQDEYDADMRAANDQANAMAGYNPVEATQVEKAFSCGTNDKGDRECTASHSKDGPAPGTKVDSAGDPLEDDENEKKK